MCQYSSNHSFAFHHLTNFYLLSSCSVDFELIFPPIIAVLLSEGARRLEELRVPYEEWHLAEGHLDLDGTPPEGIFYSRMGASSHTRDHRYAAEYTSAVLAWLRRHGRVVVNGSRALQLQGSKALQYLSMQTVGIRTPKTVVAVGKEHILEAANKFCGSPFITKHNRAGKGLGVQLFHDVGALNAYVKGPDFKEPVDGITLVQEYIQSPESYIT
ncbi:hypothetical protein GCM10025859_07180 [Alicyclobacillus fastidiosus]|nr:hypothetical protein GCM10025859_07180 [Alicyclobacillus fastidiosus]